MSKDLSLVEARGGKRARAVLRASGRWASPRSAQHGWPAVGFSATCVHLPFSRAAAIVGRTARGSRLIRQAWAGSHGIWDAYCAGRLQRVERMVKEGCRPSRRRSETWSTCEA